MWNVKNAKRWCHQSKEASLETLIPSGVKIVFDMWFPANGYSFEVISKSCTNQKLDGVSLNISYTLLGQCCVFASMYLIACYRRVWFSSKLVFDTCMLFTYCKN